MSNLGWLTAAQLKQVLPEFEQFYQTYEVEPSLVAKLQQCDKPVTITVILGTWCPDCFREVARFIRLIEILNLDTLQVSYLGVDRDKQDPQGIAQAYQFTRIPTFIVQHQAIEIGRIVEQPTQSLADDLLAILAPLTA